MSTTSLRVAEVEARVHLVRRRINSFTLQHGAYVAASALAIIAAVLVVIGLRASAPVFRASVWISVVTMLATIGAGIVWGSWRWIDLRRAATLADRRGGLSDRLATLISLRARPQSSRLMPLLVTQALDLRDRWRPESVSPRLIPRTIFMFIASLALLASTAFLERRSIESAAAETKKDGDVEQRMQSRSEPPMPQPRAETRGDSPGQATDGQSEELGHGGTLPPSSDLQADATDDGSEPIQGTELSEMPDRLQDAIRRAFNAEPMDDMRSLGAKRDENLSGPNLNGQLNDERREGDEGTSIPSAGDRKSRDEASRQPAEEPKLSADQRKGNERAGQRRDQQGKPGPHAGASTGAGEGPAPNPPVGDKADLGEASGEPTTFKLTISSFLAAVDSRGLPQRDPGTAPAARRSKEAGGVSLSEHQLNDDVLRKAEIPQEYEEVVRRTYSAGK